MPEKYEDRLWSAVRERNSMRSNGYPNAVLVSAVASHKANDQWFVIFKNMDEVESYRTAMENWSIKVTVITQV